MSQSEDMEETMDEGYLVVVLIIENTNEALESIAPNAVDMEVVYGEWDNKLRYDDAREVADILVNTAKAV